MTTWVLVVMFLRAHADHDELIEAQAPATSFHACQDGRIEFPIGYVDSDGDRVLATGCVLMRVKATPQGDL